MNHYTQICSKVLRSGAVLSCLTGVVLLSASVAQAGIKRIPVDTDRAFTLLEQCLLDGGGDHPNDHQLSMFCCAISESGVRYCISCFAGTPGNPSNCEVSASARISGRGRLQTDAPSADVAAPPSRTGTTGRGTLGRLQGLARGTVTRR